MAPTVSITEAEIYEALAAARAQAQTEADGARTVEDLTAETGLAPARIRAALKRYQTEGRLRVHQVPRTNLAGRNVCVPAYSIVAAARAAKPSKAKR